MGSQGEEGGTKIKILRNDSNKVDIRTLSARISPQNYRNNLKKMINFVRKKKIPLVFLILRDNPANTKLIKNGTNSLPKLKNALGIEQINSDIAYNNFFSVLARKYLTIAYDKIGESEKAKQILSANLTGFEI